MLKIKLGGVTMLRTKEKVIKMIEQMPEEVSVADIMAELYFCQKVKSGLKEFDEGRGIPHEGVKKRLRKGGEFVLQKAPIFK